MIVRNGNVIESRGFGLPKKASYERIAQNEGRRGTGNFFTHDAGPCIVVAAHNPTNSEGFLGHFSSVHRPADESLGALMFAQSLRQIGKMGLREDIEAWVGGGGHTYEGEVLTDTEAERAYAFDKLQRVVGSLAVRWINTPDEWVHAQIESKTGIVTVQHEIIT